ncbi:MAG: hypothetical protein ABIV50_01340, partial [Opitutus sp.]
EERERDTPEGGAIAFVEITSITPLAEIKDLGDAEHGRAGVSPWGVWFNPGERKQGDGRSFVQQL